MKVKDVIKVIEDFAPISIQEGWDNSGLCIGSPEDEVTSVMFALDCLGLIGLVVLTQTSVDFILDIVFHIWVMYYLVSAARSSSKLNRLLAEADAAPASPEFD